MKDFPQVAFLTNGKVIHYSKKAEPLAIEVGRINVKGAATIEHGLTTRGRSGNQRGKLGGIN